MRASRSLSQDLGMETSGAGPFLRREALAGGMTRRKADGRVYRRPFRGVRVPAGKGPELAETCLAAQAFLPDAACFSHVTALRLHGVEVPWRLAGDDRIHVVTPTRGPRTQRGPFVAHLCSQAALEVTLLGPLRVTTAAQAWLHLAHGMLLDDLVVLGDAMVRRRAPATTIASLSRLMEATHKMRGLARCRDALELLRPGTDSTMETRTRLLLVSAGLPCPEVNRPVYASDGTFLAMPDMQYRDLKIAIEYDGDVHRTDPATWRRDVERRQRLEDDGWLIITATADDVLRYPDRFLARVRRSRATRPAAILNPR